MSVDAIAEAQAPIRPSGLTRLRAQWRVWLCLGYLVVLVGWTVVGLPLPDDPERADSAQTLLAPGGEHWFGTDQNGYDIFSRIVLAAAHDVSMAAAGTVASAVVGSVLGVLWSRRGLGSELAMRVVDLVQAIPLLAVAITVVGLTGGSPWMLFVVIAGVNVPVFIRLVRAESILLRRRGYITVARSYGAGERRILWRHLIPNCSTVIFPQLSLSLGIAIIMISGLGFLGLSEPGAASWGAMLQGGIPLLLTGQWWVALFPSLAIFTAVLAVSEASVALQRLVERPVGRG